MSAIDKNSGSFAFKTEPEVDITAKTVRDILQTVFIELVVNLGIGMLKHVLLALKNS